MRNANKQKIVIFDLDETLGYFVEFGIFWDSLHNYARINGIDSKKIFNQEYFNDVLDIFPEFIRPNVLSVLQYIKIKKMLKRCHGVIIYTNNQGPKEWAQFIKNYFERKLKFKLFNQVINAFKVNGKHVELHRTSHDKHMGDFLRCSKLGQNIEICYLDDTYYDGMNTDNVYYVKIKPYVHDLHFDSMIRRYMHSSVSDKLLSDKNTETDFFDFMQNNMANYEFVCMEKRKEEFELDKIVTKKIMAHVRTFFSKDDSNGKRKITVKNKIYKSKTRKNKKTIK